jgi:outer membrane murein-binding lipoprotein Lpp
MYLKFSQFPVLNNPAPNAGIPVIQQGENYLISVSSLQINSSVLSVAGRQGNITLSASDIIGLDANVLTISNASITFAPISAINKLSLTTNAISANVLSLSSQLEQKANKHLDNVFTGINVFEEEAIFSGLATFDSNVSGLNKFHVGLDQVDNTSDLNKPISTATMSALNVKADLTLVNSLSTKVNTLSADPTLSLRINTLSSNISNLGNNIETLSSNINIIDNNVNALSSNVNNLNSNVISLSSNVNDVEDNLLLKTDLVYFIELSSNWVETDTVVRSNSSIWVGSDSGKANLSGGNIFSGTQTINELIVDGNASFSNDVDFTSANIVGMNKSQVGLDQVDNTSDLNKPISTNTASALNLKADLNLVRALSSKINSLSSNSLSTYTISGVDLSDYFNVNNYTIVNGETEFNNQVYFFGPVNGLISEYVGLENCDNTSDISKPVSGPQQTALNLKANQTSFITLSSRTEFGLNNLSSTKADIALVYTLSAQTQTLLNSKADSINVNTLSSNVNTLSSNVNSLGNDVNTLSSNVSIHNNNLLLKADLTSVNNLSSKVISLSSKVDSLTQTTLSGFDLKTINNLSLLGDGNINILGLPNRSGELPSGSYELTSQDAGKLVWKISGDTTITMPEHPNLRAWHSSSLSRIAFQAAFGSTITLPDTDFDWPDGIGEGPPIVLTGEDGIVVFEAIGSSYVGSRLNSARVDRGGSGTSGNIGIWNHVEKKYNSVPMTGDVSIDVNGITEIEGAVTLSMSAGALAKYDGTSFIDAVAGVDYATVANINSLSANIANKANLTSVNNLSAEVIALTNTPKISACLSVAISDEITPLTIGTNKLSIRAPFNMTIRSVKASLTTAASSGITTFDININGVSMLGNKLNIDSSETSSKTAAVSATITTPSIIDDDVITFDVDAAGSGATGAKIYFIYTQ